MKKFGFLLALIGLALPSCNVATPIFSASPNSSDQVPSISSTDASSELSQDPVSSREEPLPSSSIPSSSNPSSSADTSSSSSSWSTSYSSVPVPHVDEDPKWPVDLSTRGQDFLVTLSALIKQTGDTASRDSAISIGARAAAYPNENSSTFIPFYRAPTDANKTTQSACNREHTWPDSRGGGMFENDPVMLRPTLQSDNSDRSNFFYGLTGKDNREWDPASFGYEDARGESARVILYCATTYFDLGIRLSNNPKDGTKQNTMGTLKTLLAWNREYAPTDFERTVNDRYDKMGYRRNPFVDHPEYADYIWDNDGFRPSESTTWHDNFTDLDNLDGKKLAIVSEDNANAGKYYMMGDQAKGATIPWYITPYECRVEQGKMTCDSNVVYFTFTKTSSGAYNIQNKAGEYLFGYTNSNGTKTFYSIGFGQTSADATAKVDNPANVSAEWTITSSGSQMVFYTGTVYLEYYNGSFCGFQHKPYTNPMLFL